MCRGCWAVALCPFLSSVPSLFLAFLPCLLPSCLWLACFCFLGFLPPSFFVWLCFGFALALALAKPAARRRERAYAAIHLCEHAFVSLWLCITRLGTRTRSASWRSREDFGMCRCLRDPDNAAARREGRSPSTKRQPAGFWCASLLSWTPDDPGEEARERAANVHSDLDWYEARLALRHVVAQLHRMARGPRACADCARES